MKTINEIGSTGFIIAAYRAEEEHNKYPLFIDPYAKFFVNNEMEKKAEYLSFIIPEAKEMVRYRTIFFDNKISAFIKKGGTQIVMLGGGFDMRACKHGKKDICFFDVDQEAVLDFKQNVIEANNINYPSQFIHCNYLEDDITINLSKNGIDTSLPTLFIWEGNSPYIEKEKIFDLLNNLANNFTHFNISFDFLSHKIITRETGIKALTNAANFFEEMGSPWITGFDDINIFREKTCLKVVENILMESLDNEYIPDGSQIDTNILNSYSVCTLSNQ